MPRTSASTSTFTERFVQDDPLYDALMAARREGRSRAVTARITKIGRTLAFADIEMTAGGAVAAHATTVYALLG
jgi:hypothetical protein